MAFDCIPQKLSNWFYKYGHFLARHPLPFILIPPLVSFTLLVGVLRITMETDLEYLYAPTNAPAKSERAFFEETFPHDDDYDFVSDRMLYQEGFLLVYIGAPDETENVINGYAIDTEIMNATIELHHNILNKTFDYSGDEGQLRYSDVCARWRNDCVFINYTHVLLDVSRNVTIVKYPIHRGNYNNYNEN